ncbi:DUF982 domain-containing protein [Rhizobium sp. 11515TR]|uniref:DUF982 domain-containing protein n=1 Tax=Rhizobium sp. 11515TR TaxID=2028343 RepID=UPI000BA895FE|nr:DUF982 domain-containing protein [Rhizobium sp. 11515TR]ASW09688.1 hypothetical protein CKA34_26985 [Rhizobium sp. 11515TR]
MTSHVFDRPLFVRRKHFIQEICCLDDIVDFLEEWPEEKRGAAHVVMLRACRDAVVGQFPLSAVRKNFERFLKKNDMLASIEEFPFRQQSAGDHNIGDV